MGKSQKIFLPDGYASCDDSDYTPSSDEEHEERFDELYEELDEVALSLLSLEKKIEETNKEVLKLNRMFSQMMKAMILQADSEKKENKD
jgi:hypothetical protein|tara:strand:- start:1281 stop:1547 length:267 start_codon:yes stop_codon:yes gene_type:complete